MAYNQGKSMLTNAMRVRKSVAILSLAVFTAGAQTAPEPTATIKTSVRLVQINVVARDKKGQPVTDLKKEDFVVKDNGKVRPLSSFSLDIATSTATQKTAAPKLPLGVFTNRMEESTPKAVTIILVDALNTPFQDRASSRTQVLKAIQGIDPDSRVALLSLGTQLRVIHDFTTDTKSLLDALKKLGTEQSPMGGPSDLGMGTASDDVTSLNSFTSGADDRFADYQMQIRVQQTAAAMVAIAKRLTGVPGRKNLVWISNAFPISTGFDTSSGSGALTGMLYSDEVERATRALNDAGISVYPVDPGGLRTQPMTKGSNAIPLPPRNVDTSVAMATATGGKAYWNTNDIAGAITDAISDSKVNYTLGFSLPSDELDSKYHTLKVEVKRSGVSIEYRHSYGAFPDPTQPTLKDAISATTPYNAIGLTVKLTPIANAPGVSSSMLTFDAALNIDVNTVTVEDKDGVWSGDLEAMFVAGPVDSRAMTPQPITIRLKKDEWAKARANGITIPLRLEALPGWQLHFGVRDTASGALGTLHLGKQQ